VAVAEYWGGSLFTFPPPQRAPRSSPSLAKPFARLGDRRPNEPNPPRRAEAAERGRVRQTNPIPRPLAKLSKSRSARSLRATYRGRFRGPAPCQRTSHVREHFPSHTTERGHVASVVSPLRASPCQRTSHVREKLSERRRRGAPSQVQKPSPTIHFSLPTDLTRPKETSRREHHKSSGASHTVLQKVLSRKIAERTKNPTKIARARELSCELAKTRMGRCRQPPRLPIPRVSLSE
jgi:hypothetical protein